MGPDTLPTITSRPEESGETWIEAWPLNEPARVARFVNFLHQMVHAADVDLQPQAEDHYRFHLAVAPSAVLETLLQYSDTFPAAIRFSSSGHLQIRFTDEGDETEAAAPPQFTKESTATFIEAWPLAEPAYVARFVNFLHKGVKASDIDMQGQSDGHYRFHVGVPPSRLIEVLLASAGLFPAALRSSASGQLQVRFAANREADASTAALPPLEESSDSGIEAWPLSEPARVARFVTFLHQVVHADDVDLQAQKDGHYRFNVPVPPSRVLEFLLQFSSTFPAAIRSSDSGQFQVRFVGSGDPGATSADLSRLEESAETWIEAWPLTEASHVVRFATFLNQVTQTGDIELQGRRNGHYRFHVSVPPSRVIESLLLFANVFPAAIRSFASGHLQIRFADDGEFGAPRTQPLLEPGSDRPRPAPPTESSPGAHELQSRRTDEPGQEEAAHSQPRAFRQTEASSSWTKPQPARPAPIPEGDREDPQAAFERTPFPPEVPAHASADQATSAAPEAVAPDVGTQHLDLSASEAEIEAGLLPMVHVEGEAGAPETSRPEEPELPESPAEEGLQEAKTVGEPSEPVFVRDEPHHSEIIDVPLTLDAGAASSRDLAAPFVPGRSSGPSSAAREESQP
ncbi:MAG: hypothetical protein ACR2PL_27015, partial [Dehalococcoidia bacterium]